MKLGRSFFFWACALAATANATVDFFFSSSADPYGLKNPALAFLATNGNGRDFLDGYELLQAGGSYAVPPYAEPGVMPDAELWCGQPTWAYIWGRFNNEPPATEVGRLSGITIEISGAAPGQGSIAYYICNNLADENIQAKRWDGEPHIFYYNPASLISVTSASLRNRAVDVPWNLYVGGDHRVFLLGAVKCNTCPSELTINVTAICYAGTPSNPTPPCPEPRSLNKVVCVVPEPTGTLLLVLVTGLVTRQMRRAQLAGRQR